MTANREWATDYLLDLIENIKQVAIEARSHPESSTEADRAFEAGRRTAYYEVVTLMQQQARSFGIALVDLHLDDVIPDRDLL